VNRCQETLSVQGGVVKLRRRRGRDQGAGGAAAQLAALPVSPAVVPEHDPREGHDDARRAREDVLSAWEEHDYEWLVSAGYLTQSDVENA
jgi:hypothetical protein